MVVVDCVLDFVKNVCHLVNVDVDGQGGTSILLDVIQSPLRLLQIKSINNYFRLSKCFLLVKGFPPMLHSGSNSILAPRHRGIDSQRLVACRDLPSGLGYGSLRCLSHVSFVFPALFATVNEELAGGDDREVVLGVEAGFTDVDLYFSLFLGCNGECVFT